MFLLILLSLFPQSGTMFGVQLQSITELPSYYTVQFARGNHRWAFDLGFDVGYTKGKDTVYNEGGGLRDDKHWTLNASIGLKYIHLGASKTIFKDKTMRFYWSLGPYFRYWREGDTLNTNNPDSTMNKSCEYSRSLKPGMSFNMGLEVGSFKVLGKDMFLQLNAGVMSVSYNDSYTSQTSIPVSYTHLTLPTKA